MTKLDLTRTTSLYSLPLPSQQDDPNRQILQELIEYTAQLLPAEGPISSFVFQNPLHAFEYLHFDQAVELGSSLFGCQPYLSENRYREELARGRIRMVDVRSELERDLGSHAWESIEGLVSRLDIRLGMLQTQVMYGTDEELSWFRAETEALTRFRPDAPTVQKQRIIADAKRWAIRDLVNKGSQGGGYQEPGAADARRRHVLWPIFGMLEPLLHAEDVSPDDRWADATWEAFALNALWEVCRSGVLHVRPAEATRNTTLPRHRDMLLRATGYDADGPVHDLLIRYCAAFTDQGMASWQIPGRDAGFFACFCQLYSSPGQIPGRWAAGVAGDLRDWIARGVDPLTAVQESLVRLGVSPQEWEEYLPAAVLPLRGWASMIRQMEVRPDRVPHPVPTGTLMEFLAVRLLLDCHALTWAARHEIDYRGPLAGLREKLKSRVKHDEGGSIEQRTLTLFQLGQVFGWCPSELNQLSSAQWTNLVNEIERFPSMARRRLLHRAYERAFRSQALDAVAAQRRPQLSRVQAPRFQAVFCIDAREESFRRHLEEVAPDCETFGAAGFFGVPIYYRGVGEAHSAAQCPIVLRPKHWVREEVAITFQDVDRRRARARQVLGTTTRHFQTGSRDFAGGALLSAGVGILASIPLVANVLFPRLSSRLRRTAARWIEPPTITRLTVERIADEPGPTEEGCGFNVAEMAVFAERILRDIGLTTNFARVVILFGHGAHCVNNPHKSAYDCGACSGNPGGANARALAAMLNDPRVRAILVKQGITVPDTTIFVGVEHNTTVDRVRLFDLDNLPGTHRGDIESAMSILERTCERNAHERCRRFDSAPLNQTPAAARAHVERRSEDLAQTRPEFGNATNAMCVVGRRSRTRGLYLDRRSFLHSYDPSADDAEHTILARILSAVVPVCQGINLEYFFSAIDPAGWGCGTKLPHNVTSMLGVMDGAASDLRQGLPWQGVEIHEPLRLMFVIESTPEAMFSIMERNKTVGRILKNGWAQLAVLDPNSNQIRVFANGEFHLYHPERSTLPRVNSSAEWYMGRRDNLDFCTIATV